MVVELKSWRQMHPLTNAVGRARRSCHVSWAAKAIKTTNQIVARLVCRAVI